MMAAPEDETKQPQVQQLFMRADEVDAGTTVISSGTQKPLSALSPANGTNAGTTRPKPPPRPILRREGSAAPPPPPSQPPPAPPAPIDNVTDSLSLPQLRQLVGQFPKPEQQAYAYEYRDAEDYPTEVDEWFHYTELDQDRENLLAAREAFEQRWRSFCQSVLNRDDASWTLIDTKHRQTFISQVAAGIGAESESARQEALATMYYILVGAWSINAGLETGHEPSTEESKRPERYNQIQIRWMHEGSDLVSQAGVVELVYENLRKVLDKSADVAAPRENVESGTDGFFEASEYREISLGLSCLYLIAESSRARQPSIEAEHIRQTLMELEPNLLVHLVSIISRVRWDESYNIPLMHALQLLWKLILIFFGDIQTHQERVRSTLQPRVDRFSSDAAHPILTASPLDYHLFRQEVISKYPAYNPPPPLIPLEPEQKSILPPLPNPSRTETLDGLPVAANVPGGGGSILHQPVHIATPAPSPPPSPVGPGGKAGKKQNYQTAQNFPFLYPPLDSGSNNIGGKGSTQFQDAMVGKRWEGSDIPASIIEAGELFASRMRMTRAMRQLWEQRDEFTKYERGWQGSEQKTSSSKSRGSDKAELKDPDLQGRMDAVDEFFHDALPDLQSLVIVMMKVMLTNVQDIAVRNGGAQESQINGLSRTKSNPNMAQSQSLPMPPPPPRPNEMSLEDLDNIRSREISQKAMSGVIFLLLKWFKMSHVLKFEYMTQLLLDSNYIQLTLKYFAHQNLEDLVAFKYDRDDLSFWHYCHIHSDHPPLSPTSPDSNPHSDVSSADEAIPPPIQRHRRSPTTNSDGISGGLVQSPEQTQTQRVSSYPSVDELGNPLAPLPNTPITTFSPRQFQTSIHLLRVLQKLTRSKSHRILLLVQFKSSQIFRRILRVPDPLLRLYVLKLFKSQVPYCGRKWRQSNMRVITAIYLHCRPELRDEWLAGMHDINVEGEVEEAVPLEWALRGLTFWWMKRTYPDVMKLKTAKKKEKEKEKARAKQREDKLDKDVDTAALGGEDDGDDDDDYEELGQEVDDDERDFFQRELDAMGWGMAGLSVGDEVGFGEEAPGANIDPGIGYGIANGVGMDGDNSYQGTWEGGSGHHGVAQNSSVGTGGMEMW